MDKKLAYLLLSIAGILILLLISLSQKPTIVSGKILDIKDYSEFKIIKLENFTVTCYKCEFKVNQTIQVTGRQVVYKGKPEINADKIEIINKNAA